MARKPKAQTQPEPAPARPELTPAVGSSRISTGGLCTIALATISRRFMPPES